jgi:nucleoside-diphosphate-sugar epimerase
MDRTALIGHTGFVGANLAAQAPFDEKYNSRNIDDIRGKRFGLVVCAGAYAAKWKANKDPEGDRAALEKLMAPLREVEAARFILISTVDVHPRPEMVDEDSPLEGTPTPYGRHRRALEELCAERFSATILRLPGLFGPGLRKNVIYDLLLNHQVENIHPDGVYQYYSLAHLWRDANMALERGIRVLNVACEPIPTRELALRCFGRELSTYPTAPPALYDLRSKHAPLWGGQPFGYLYSKERVLGEIAGFVEKERAL